MIWIVLGIIAVIVLWAVAFYNGVIMLKKKTSKYLGDIEIALEKAASILTNSFNLQKDFLNKQENLLNKVTEMRTKLGNANTLKEKVEATNDLAKSINVAVEAYPEMKGEDLTKQVITEVKGVFGEISTEKRLFNNAVYAYNAKIAVFPNVLLAKLFHFEESPYLEIDEQSKKVPTYSVDSSN